MKNQFKLKVGTNEFEIKILKILLRALAHDPFLFRRMGDIKLRCIIKNIVTIIIVLIIAIQESVDNFSGNPAIRHAQKWAFPYRRI